MKYTVCIGAKDVETVLPDAYAADIKWGFDMIVDTLGWNDADKVFDTYLLRDREKHDLNQRENLFMPLQEDDLFCIESDKNTFDTLLEGSAPIISVGMKIYDEISKKVME